MPGGSKAVAGTRSSSSAGAGHVQPPWPGPVSHHFTKGGDLPEVAGHEQQGDEDALGGDAAHPPAPGGCERLVGWVFEVAVQAFDGVAVTGIGTCPFLAAEGEVLAVAGTDVRGDGYGRLGADLGGTAGGERTGTLPTALAAEEGRSGQQTWGCSPWAGQAKRS